MRLRGEWIATQVSAARMRQFADPTSSTAWSESLPWPMYSKPCRLARPGERGTSASQRPSARITGLLSSQHTAACARSDDR